MTRLFKMSILAVALAASSTAAFADSIITGSIGFAGSGTVTANGQFKPGPSIGAPINDNAYVNSISTTGSLSMFTFLNPAHFSAFNLNTLPATNIFTSTENGVTISFDLTSAVFGPNAAGYGYAGVGILHETGYLDTPYNFSVNSTGNAVFTSSATSVAATPEPSSLMLLGTGLLSAAGIVVRRRHVA